MKKHMRAALVAMGLTVSTMACDRGKAEADRRATEAQQQSQEATLTAAKVKADAEEATKMRAAHADTRAKLQREYDATDRKLGYLKERAAKTTGITKKNADAALAEVETRRAAAKASMNRLANDTDPAWDATKKSAEDELAALGKAVDALDHTLSKK